MIDSLCSEQLEILLYTLWAVWVERNNLVWRGGCFVHVNVAKWVCQHLEEYKKFHGRGPKKKARRITKWQCPPRGRLKVNIDGSFLVERGCGGVGVVIRDDKGECRAALARPLPAVMSALQAEVESLRAGLLVAMHQGWEEIEVETDCLSLAQALEGEFEDLSEAGRVLEDCKRYVSSFKFFSIRHVLREANGVAHRLAHLATWSGVDELWEEETPAIIQDVIFEDSCNNDRGLGDMSPPFVLVPNSININEAPR